MIRATVTCDCPPNDVATTSALTLPGMSTILCRRIPGRVNALVDLEHSTPGSAFTLISVGADGRLVVNDLRKAGGPVSSVAEGLNGSGRVTDDYVYCMKVAPVAGRNSSSTVLLGDGHGWISGYQIQKDQPSYLFRVKVTQNAIRCIRVVNGVVVAAGDDGNVMFFDPKG